MHNVEVLSRAFPARINAVEALIQATNTRTNNAAQLRQAASALDSAGPLYGRASTAAVYAAFAELLRIVALLVEWRAAVLEAGLDAERFLRGAKERHRLWVMEYGATDPTACLAEAGAQVIALSSIEEVSLVCHRIVSTPLPIGVFSDEYPRFSTLENVDDKEKEDDPPELAIAFLRFIIDGVPADETHFLTPGEAHDLEIEVRVSRWPDGAEGLSLSPISIEPTANYDFPTFEFPRPSGDPPFQMQKRGRAILRVPQSLQAQPFEFKYTGSFLPIAVEQPVAIVGQRTLRIEGYDLARAPVTGYVGIDLRLLRVRDELRTQPLITSADQKNVLTVLTPLCSLAGRALQDALFRKTCSEADFQAEVRNGGRQLS